MAWASMRRFRQRLSRKVFVIKGIGPIHSAKEWKMGKESGLFVTSCGLVVSIHQSSTETSDAGYRVIVAKMETCDNCRKKDRKQLIATADDSS